MRRLYKRLVPFHEYPVRRTAARAVPVRTPAFAAVASRWRKSMPRVRSLFLSICAVILATVGSAGAQEFCATVKGQVADTSAAALPGATVTVQNQHTNEAPTATTNTDGAYTIPFLRPGTYTLTVEMSGFQKNIRKDMR